MNIFLLQGRYCQEIGIDANDVAEIYFFNGLASAIFRAVTGRLCDIRRDIPIWIMKLTAFVSGTVVILMTLWSSFKQLLACFFVFGMMDGAFASSMNVSVLATLSQQQKSQGIGFFHLCLSSMLVAGAPFGGELFNNLTASCCELFNTLEVGYPKCCVYFPGMLLETKTSS